MTTVKLQSLLSASDIYAIKQDNASETDISRKVLQRVIWAVDLLDFIILIAKMHKVEFTSSSFRNLALRILIQPF